MIIIVLLGSNKTTTESEVLILLNITDMALMNWTSALSVNIFEIDLQHQKLINILNKLHKAMKERRADLIIASTLDDLIGYTKMHFATEERYFRLYKYPHAEEHIAEHALFIAKIQEFTKKYKKGNVSISIDLMHYIADWIRDHIKGTDDKYTEFFHAKGLK